MEIPLEHHLSHVKDRRLFWNKYWFCQFNPLPWYKFQIFTMAVKCVIIKDREQFWNKYWFANRSQFHPLHYISLSCYTPNKPNVPIRSADSTKIGINLGIFDLGIDPDSILCTDVWLVCSNLVQICCLLLTLFTFYFVYLFICCLWFMFGHLLLWILQWDLLFGLHKCLLFHLPVRTNKIFILILKMTVFNIKTLYEPNQGSKLFDWT